MIVRDWREAPPDVLAPLYEAERQRWLRTLQWDSTPVWREVELARTTWGLPGLLAVDGAGRVRGSAFYLSESDRLDIGGLTADHADATAALIDGVIDAAGVEHSRIVRAMLFSDAPALEAGLATRGFDIRPHLYLSRVCSGARASSDPAPAADTWKASDVCETAALLRRAYDAEAGSLFAPGHEPGEWERYVRNLVDHSACGTLNPQATRVVRDGSAIRAIALVTDIGPRCAHLVQLAVDPSLRGRGLGAALVEEACRGLAVRQYRALTLLVAHTNGAARALYDRAGFRHDASFLAATKTLAA